jgi:MFS family permease
MSSQANAIDAPGANSRSLARGFVLAWGCCVLFYFLEYAVRSAPAVMIPELSTQFSVSALGLSAILGVYYYTYSTFSLLAGVLLDRYGAKYVVPAGAAVLGIGCVLFSMPAPFMGDLGRLLQGGGSAFAFTGAVYLAAHGLPRERQATAIGITQCVGMLGGSVGQLGVGPLIHMGLGTPTFWTLIGTVVLLNAITLVILTPRESIPTAQGSAIVEMLQTYKVVFKNPQSYLCGIVAGLLFAPTTILDMVWGVRFLQGDRLFSYPTAVFTAGMVPLGWVVGCPLMGWVADHWRRRKPALFLGMFIMLVCFLELAVSPRLVPEWLVLLLIGIGSGSAMIPYSIIKEVNPDRVKGSATGAMNFLTFSVTAIVGPIFASQFGRTLATAPDHGAHIRHTDLFWIGTICLALLIALALRETGGAIPQARSKPPR